MPAPSPTTRDRLATLCDQARARWLDPAEKEFSERGFENASLNRIIAAAGESKGRTYHYFANKGELFRATLERRLARIGPQDFSAEAMVLSDKDAFWRQLAAASSRLTEAFQRDDHLAALLRTLHGEAAAQRAFAEPLSLLRGRIEALLIAGQSIGAVRDDLPLSLMTEVSLNLISTIDRWFALNANGLAKDEEADLSQRAFTVLMAPLLPPDNSGETVPCL